METELRAQRVGSTAENAREELRRRRRRRRRRRTAGRNPPSLLKPSLSSGRSGRAPPSRRRAGGPDNALYRRATGSGLLLPPSGKTGGRAVSGRGRHTVSSLDPGSSAGEWERREPCSVTALVRGCLVGEDRKKVAEEARTREGAPPHHQPPTSFQTTHHAARKKTQ
jgi:hypothetical protein